MKWLVLLLLCIPVSGAQFYVATTGTNGATGTITDPLSLSNALSVTSPANAGDTIWMRGGTYYGGYTCNLSAPSNNPIVVRAYSSELPVLDSTNAATGLAIEGSGVWFWGLDIVDSYTNRYDDTRHDGVSFNSSSPGANNKLINCTIHDNNDAVFLSKQSTNAEVTGCVIYNNGRQDTDRGHGHDYYVQNYPNSGTKLARCNIMLNSFDSGVHAYGAAVEVSGISVLDNIVYGSGNPCTNGVTDNFIFLSGVILKDIVISGNVGYVTASSDFVIGAYQYTNQDNVIFTNNYSVTGNNSFYDWTNLMCIGNTFGIRQGGMRYGFMPGAASTYTVNSNTYYALFDNEIETNGWTAITFDQWQGSGFDTNSSYTLAYPTNPVVIIKQNPYEPLRANIAVVNYASNATVNVDVSSVLSPGNRFSLKHAANFYGTPVVSGTYTGQVLSVPTTGLTPVQVIGWTNTPPETGPMFNAFVLLGQYVEPHAAIRP